MANSRAATSTRGTIGMVYSEDPDTLAPMFQWLGQVPRDSAFGGDGDPSDGVSEDHGRWLCILNLLLPELLTRIPQNGGRNCQNTPAP